MSNHTDSRKSVFEGCSVGTHVDAIGQSAYDECVGTLRREVAYKPFAHVAPIIGAFACANYAYYFTRIQNGITLIEQQDGSIITFAQARRIVLIVIPYTCDVMLLDELKFLLNVLKGYWVAECTDQ